MFHDLGFIESFHAKSISSRFLASSSSSDASGRSVPSRESNASIAYASAAFTVSVKPIDRPLGISQMAQISIPPSYPALSSFSVMIFSVTGTEEDHSDQTVLLKPPFAPE